MPLFTFSLRTARGPHEDQPTGDLPGVAEARLEAVRRAGRLVEHTAGTADLDEDWQMEVKDADGIILFWLDVFITTPPLPSDPNV